MHAGKTRFSRRGFLRASALGIGGLILAGAQHTRILDNLLPPFARRAERIAAASGHGGVLDVPKFENLLPNALHPSMRLAPTPQVDPLTGVAYDFYSITMRRGTHDFGLGRGRTTEIWGYNGQFPGPTIDAYWGRETRMTAVNDLQLPDRFGHPWTTSVHYHGGITAPEHDGYSGDIGVYNPDGSPVLVNGRLKRLPTELSQGMSWTYIFPNRQTATLNFYHDHGHHHTSENVYRGLVAFYLQHDDSDRWLQDNGYLPTYPYEVVMTLQDKLFASDGSLIYDAEENGYVGLVGNVQTVNGKAWPRMQVEPRKYRLRILNGSIWRHYALRLSNGRPFLQIGTDDGFLNAPVSVPMVRLSFAERVDVIVDFSGLSVGAEVKLLNTDEESRGTPMSEVMLFEIVPPSSTPLVDTKLPDAAAFRAAGIGWEVLTDEPTVDAALRYMKESRIERDFRFERKHGMWTINGETWDINRFAAEPRLGTTEVWTFVNKSGGWRHPIHTHLFDFQIIDRNGKPPHPWELGRKDTVDLGENDKIRVIIKFDPVKYLGFTGPYMFHCHNTDHEDHDMMTQFKVVT